jgi:hypothetical protein
VCGDPGQYFSQSTTSPPFQGFSDFLHSHIKSLEKPIDKAQDQVSIPFALFLDARQDHKDINAKGLAALDCFVSSVDIYKIYRWVICSAYFMMLYYASGRFGSE